MKNIVRSLIALTLFAGFTSCEDEENLMFLESTGDFQILTPQSGESVVLGQDTPNNPALVMTWEAVDYGTPTEITYTIEIDENGNDFASPSVLATTTSTFLSVNMETLNSAALGAGLEPFSEGGIDIRVMSSVGSSEAVYSNIITYLVTPYSTDLPKLYVPGSYQAAAGYGDNWTPASAPTLAAAAFGDPNYEGYIYVTTDMTDPADEGFKINTLPSWDGTNYGDDGSFTGTLSPTGGNVLANAGLYRVRVNTETLAYSLGLVNWGIIGAATPGGWDNDTDLTYNPATRKLEIASIAMVPGAFKFRGNDAWSNGFDYGTVNADGYLVDGGDLTFDGPAGNYKVILDLSNPRKYTYEFIAL